MLRIVGHGNRSHDRLHRRRFLQIGALAPFGLTLANQLQAEARGGSRSQKAVILIWQHGGPSQLDTFDMKPLAPAEYRGPFESIDSALPGLPVCELLPCQARVMDKCTVIRSFSHGNGDHWAAAHWMLTGRLGANGSDRVPRQPSIGAVASHLLGPTKPGSLASVNMNDGGFGYHGGSWLGVAHNPFRTGEFSYGNEAGRLPTGDAKSFALVDSLSEDRLLDRISLQRQFDQLLYQVDATGTFANMDQIDSQALDILLSGRTRDAFDLSQEDQQTRDAYGPGWGEQAPARTED